MRSLLTVLGLVAAWPVYAECAYDPAWLCNLAPYWWNAYCPGPSAPCYNNYSESEAKAWILDHCHADPHVIVCIAHGEITRIPRFM
jgi:hypothetical protein